MADQEGRRMAAEESVILLYRGGRLPAWYRLPAAEKQLIEQQHVDLMLAVAAARGLRRLSGYRLLAPQGAWERIWVISFPDLAGADAWIEAEMAPPYGAYGYYDYLLARPVAIPAGPPAPEPASPMPGDPHQVPPLSVDRSRLTIFVFGWQDDGPVLAQTEPAGTLEAFRLLTPQKEWDTVWLVEQPTVVAAESWLEAAATAVQATETPCSFLLTRPWAPAYFAAWHAG